MLENWTKRSFLPFYFVTLAYVSGPSTFTKFRLYSFFALFFKAQLCQPQTAVTPLCAVTGLELN